MAHKHKNANSNPIIQIPPIEYFSKDAEALPVWIKNHKKGEKVNFSELLASRIVYYPGSALEGSPIHVFNKAHAAHVYLYIDYSFEKEKIKKMMSESIPLGYHIYDECEVSLSDILPNTLRYHLTTEEKNYVMEQYKTTHVPTQNSFAFLKIYERDESYSEEHGALRFAVLFLSGDAIATYDAIFGNTAAKPFACIISPYGFGGEYESFTGGSLLEKIAIRINRLPKYLVCDKDFGWSGYEMLKTVSGMKYRFVWIKEKLNKSL